MISMPAAPTAPTARDIHRVVVVNEKLKKLWPSGVMNANAANPTIEPTSAVFHGRNGLDSTTRIQNAVNSRAIVAAVDGCQQMTFATLSLDSVFTKHSDAGGAPTSLRARTYDTSTTMPETTPAGTANRSTRLRKPGTYRRLFGPRARKKAGMPIVTADTRVRCRGRNGNGRVNSAAVMIAIRLITFFATNRLATRSTLPITRRPSASTFGRSEKRPSSSTK